VNAACEKLQAFADGELSPAEIPGFQHHLVDCRGCQAELQDVMLLDALGLGLGPVPAEIVPAPAPRPRWRRRSWIVWGLAALAVAAIAVLLASIG
jgi:anti-sigma factor RsiW